MDALCGQTKHPCLPGGLGPHRGFVPGPAQVLLSSVSKGPCLRLSLCLSVLTWEMGEMTGLSPSEDCKDQLRKHPGAARGSMEASGNERLYSSKAPILELASNGLT